MGAIAQEIFHVFDNLCCLVYVEVRRGRLLTLVFARYCVERDRELPILELSRTDESVDLLWGTADFQFVAVEPVVWVRQDCLMGSEVLDQFDVPECEHHVRVDWVGEDCTHERPRPVASSW